MARSRKEVLRSAKLIGPKGESGGSSGKANNTFWSERASANSYHGSKSGERGTSRLGDADMNHDGDSTFQPGVRREA